MKEFILLLAGIIVVFAVFAGIKISVSPFSISLESWPAGLGWTLIILGILLIKYDAFNDGCE